MTRQPWAITREMFLSLGEVDHLVGHVRARADVARGDERVPARLDQFIIEALLFSGLRNSEFCTLRLGDTVAATGRPAFVVRPPEGEERTVYIPASLAELTREWVRQTRPLLLPPGVAPDDPSQALVFNEHHRPYERTGLYRRVVRILTDTGLGSRASVQLLRHTYGYLAYLRTGGNLLFVQRQLGHAHPMVTSIYAQFVDESYEAMADRLCSEPEPVEPAPGPRFPAAIEDDAADDRDPDRLL